MLSVDPEKTFTKQETLLGSLVVSFLDTTTDSFLGDNELFTENHIFFYLPLINNHNIF